jgi:O-antigen/teichoic acid export membrane protein
MKSNEKQYWFLISGIATTIVFSIVNVLLFINGGFIALGIGFVGFGVGGVSLFLLMGMIYCWISYYQIYKIKQMGFNPDGIPTYDSNGKRVR